MGLGVLWQGQHRLAVGEDVAREAWPLGRAGHRAVAGRAELAAAVRGEPGGREGSQVGELILHPWAAVGAKEAG